MVGPRSFGESFRLHHAVQTIVTTAARNGSPVCGPSAVSVLAGSFSSFTQAELETILKRAALEHDVRIAPAPGDPQGPVEAQAGSPAQPAAGSLGQ